MTNLHRAVGMAADSGVPPELPLTRAAGVLRAYCSNLTSAARWMHSSWTMALLQIDHAQFGAWTAALAPASDDAVRDVSLALCRCAEIDTCDPLHIPSEPALRAGTVIGSPKLHLLDSCAPAIGLQILRMRSIWFRRAQTRRIIDKRVRMRLSEWAGVHIDVLCGDETFAERAPAEARFNGPSLAELDAETLCAEGLALIERDVGTLARASLKVLRCALPKALPCTAPIDAAHGCVDARGTVRLFERLPVLLPEWAWLFG